jgi:uncharacterized protein YdbL (DUF1318 family)
MRPVFAFYAALCLLLQASWTTSAPTEDALIIRSVRDASGANAFSDIKSNDTSVSIILEPDAPWEEFIAPAPTVVALLGQLMVISGKVDFSLQENAPQGGFKYMRHPESFRASLVQVSNDGWTAFLKAHTNMDKIQLYMQQIPAQVKTSVKIISQASPKLVERLLPIALSRIQEIGRTCVDLAAETETKFVDVMLLLGELLAVTESSKGTHERKLAEVQTELNVTAVQKEYLEKMGDELRKRQEQVDAQVQKYRAAYDDALKKIPTGWKALAQDLFRSAINLVNFVPGFLKGFGGKGSGGGTGGSGTGSGGPGAPDIEKSSTFNVIGQVFNGLGKIKNAIKKVFSGQSPAQGNPGAMFSSYGVVLNSFENMLQQLSPSPLKTKALGFLQDGKSIFGNLEQMFSNWPGTLDEQQKGNVTQCIEDLEDSMKPVVAEGEQYTGGLATSQAAGQQQSGGGMDSGVFSGNYGNERFKAYLQLQMLRDAEARYDQIFGEMLKYHEQMKQLMSRMATLNLQEINYQDILELLKEGIKILAKVREQWGRLVQFFSLVSVRAEVALNQTLVPFVSYAKEAESMIEGGGLSQEDRKFFLDLLQDQAVQINRVAYFLYTLSRTYFDVSTRFLMDRLAGLSRMLATSDEAERQQLLLDLQRQTNEAQDAIKQIAQQRREEYGRLVDARKNELQGYINNLGGPDEKDVRAVEQGRAASRSA